MTHLATLRLFSQLNVVSTVDDLSIRVLTIVLPLPQAIPMERIFLCPGHAEWALMMRERGGSFETEIDGASRVEWTYRTKTRFAQPPSPALKHK